MLPEVDSEPEPVVRPVLSAAALTLALSAAPAAAHMTPECLGAILKYSAGAAGQTALAFPLAGADEATAAAMRPYLAELQRKTRRAMHAAYRECIEAWDSEAAPAGAPAVPARVVRIVDGDTVEVDARPWPGQRMRVAVRLAGYDAPELRGECAAEREAARAAAAALMRLLPEGAEIRLDGVRPGKFAERMIARVLTADGRDAVASLLEDGHGRPHAGGRRAGWCG